jgi:hypothetical protein
MLGSTNFALRGIPLGPDAAKVIQDFSKLIAARTWASAGHRQLHIEMDGNDTIA